MTTPDQQAAIARMRGWLTGVVSRGSNIEPDVVRLLAAYDAAQTELGKQDAELVVLRAERDALKAKLSKASAWINRADHFGTCGEDPCTCGLTAALEGSR